eukprot:GHVS01052897.1.p1 GENE.GHVS01052897.1~~GHVS01052897.1.p1  ORF type:complete len:875 (+),score=90.37 GHVS01052897.1:523-3147(+)
MFNGQRSFLPCRHYLLAVRQFCVPSAVHLLPEVEGRWNFFVSCRTGLEGTLLRELQGPPFSLQKAGSCRMQKGGVEVGLKIGGREAASRTMILLALRSRVGDGVWLRMKSLRKNRKRTKNIATEEVGPTIEASIERRWITRFSCLEESDVVKHVAGIPWAQFLRTSSIEEISVKTVSIDSQFYDLQRLRSAVGSGLKRYLEILPPMEDIQSSFPSSEAEASASGPPLSLLNQTISVTVNSNQAHVDLCVSRKTTPRTYAYVSQTSASTTSPSEMGAPPAIPQASDSAPSTSMHVDERRTSAAHLLIPSWSMFAETQALKASASCCCSGLRVSASDGFEVLEEGEDGVDDMSKARRTDGNGAKNFEAEAEGLLADRKTRQRYPSLRSWRKSGKYGKHTRSCSPEDSPEIKEIDTVQSTAPSDATAADNDVDTGPVSKQTMNDNKREEGIGGTVEPHPLDINAENKSSTTSVSEERQRDPVSALDQLWFDRVAFIEKNRYYSDDAYDLSDTIAAAVEQHVGVSRMLKKLTKDDDSLLVWDPFCGNGNLLLEVLASCLGVPVSKPSLPNTFMEFDSFDRTSYEKAIGSLALLPLSAEDEQATARRQDSDSPENFEKKVRRKSKLLSRLHLVGSDTRELMTAQAHRRLHQFCDFYADYIPPRIGDDCVSPGLSEATVAQAPSKSFEHLFVSGPQIIGWGSTKRPCSNRPQDEGKPIVAPVSKRRRRQTGPLINSEKRAALNGAQTGKLRLPCEVSFHKAPFETVASFMRGPLVMTRIPFARESRNGTGIDRKALLDYDKFGHMLASRNDWKAVFVLCQGRTFKQHSRLEWETVFTVNDTPKRGIRLLRWTGRRKSPFDNRTADQQLAALDRLETQSPS